MMSTRRKILLLLPILGGGGAERVFLTLLRHLDRDRFEVHLAVHNIWGSYMNEVPDDVVVHDLKCSRARYALVGLVRLVRSLRPAAVLSTLRESNFVLILGRPFLPRETRVFVRESQPPGGEWPNASKVRSFLYRRFFYPWLYKRADKVVCIYDGMATEFAVDFRIPREKLIRIYNPVDSERVKELSGARSNPYSGPGPQLVAVGRLSWEKGFDILLQALPRVREAFPQAKLAILGHGGLNGLLEKQARDLGLSDAVEFLGFQENPWLFIKHADLFVLPSRVEGLSNVLLEAMVLKKSIVAADCPGAIREVQAFNPALVLVRPDDPDALAGAIISSCGAGMASRCTGEPYCLQPFSLKEIVNKYGELLLGQT